MNIIPLREDLKEYLRVHNLDTKWEKAIRLFEENLRHKSLNLELLEPKWRGIYSIRIDKKYRALFFKTKTGEIEFFAITNHYKKK